MTASYDESQCPIPPHRGHPGTGQVHDERIRELALEAAKERSLAEQATRARNTAQASVRELEAEVKEEYDKNKEEFRKNIIRETELMARAEKAEAELYCGSTGHCHHTPPCRAHLIEYYQRETSRAEKAEAVSRPEECPWRETDLGCPCEVPGLDNDGVRDKAIIDTADALKKAETRVAELLQELCDHGYCHHEARERRKAE